jgi:hypothetical protein
VLLRVDAVGLGVTSTSHTRRRLLTVSGSVLAGLAGCTGDADATATEGETAADDSDAGSDGDAQSADLDLREANVVAVGVEEVDGGYRFDVTLVHDDDGEEGYADWWQVETLDGERLGRRELAHAHGTREFTRSATVPVPDGTACVVVRGHDRTHGYGGRAVIVNVETGSESGVRQGPERQSVADRGC